MNKMMHRLFISLVSIVCVACGSNAFRAQSGLGELDELVYPLVVESERETVLPHLCYSLDLYGVDYRCGAVELSFSFSKESGDSLLWVECVERIPVALIDTALCRRWFNYE